jgi:hypothetical protein
METLERYFDLQEQIYDYFGYTEDWVAIPILDSRVYHWRIIGGESYGGKVVFSADADDLINGEGNNYSNSIYTQRHLPKWVYRGCDYTMICVDTHTDGNKFLQIFSNNLEMT